VARLEPKGIEVAWNGEARFAINTGAIPGMRTVDLWERIVPFGATTMPDFRLVQSEDDYHEVTRSSLPLGSLYQVRLYDSGYGRRSGDGNVLSALDFPSLVKSSDHPQLIDRCLQAPQIDFLVGGTYASASVAVCPPGMARVQLGRGSPVSDTGLGYFAAQDTVASAVSLAPNNMHRLDITSRPSEDEDPLLPGNDYGFVVLVWNENGLWDFAWNTAGSGPPGTLTLKRRRVQVRLADLFIIDDSDKHSPGEATFTLEVTRGSSSTTTLSFNDTVHSGHQLIAVSPKMRVDTGAAKVVSLHDGSVSVNVKAHEDDSGSVPSDSDDYSHAYFGHLDLPSGPGEQVSNQILSVNSIRDSGNTFSFTAQIVYSVRYE